MININQQYKYNFTGKNVHAYVFDSGINMNHRDFLGRIGNGINAVDIKSSVNDCHGHGTHVSGTIGGTKYGVAKNVVIHPIKVFIGCSNKGWNSDLIKGIDWVIKNKKTPAVANLSLGSGPSSAVDTAVNSMIKEGIVTVVSAGNDNDNACMQTPARVKNAITVASSTAFDYKSSFSNTGSCVDIFAPGDYIKSAYIGHDNALASLSGTSMAAPHVAGVVAKYLEKKPNSTVSEVTSYIIEKSMKNKVKGIVVRTDTPNRLLYSRIDWERRLCYFPDISLKAELWREVITEENKDLYNWIEKVVANDIKGCYYFNDEIEIGIIEDLISIHPTEEFTFEENL